MTILISKYKTGVDYPPLTTSLNHLSGENTLSFPYKTGDSQSTFQTTAGVHLCLVNGGKLILTDDTDTFTVAFGSTNITITWHSRVNSLADVDDVVFIFNAFAKPVSGLTRLKYVTASGQTEFTGNDANGTALTLENNNIQVFKNEQFLEDTDFTINTTTDTLTISSASAGDIISIFVYGAVGDSTDLNNSISQAATSATTASNHSTTAQRWAINPVNTSVIDVNTGVDSNEYSAKAYAIGDNQAGGSAKEWAIGGSGNVANAVEGTDFSAKYYATQGNVATVATNMTAITNVANNETNINSVNSNATNINAVASVVANNALDTVATNIAKVQTAADDLNETVSEIDTVANAITNIDNVGNDIANVNTVAGAVTNINTVVPHVTNIGTVATNINNVNTVGNNMSSVTTVANNISNINTANTNVTAFNQIYLGAASSAPTQDPDGSALDTGDLYFDSSSNQLKVYGSSGWQNAGSSVNGTSERFTYTISSGTPSSVSGADDNGNTLAYDAGFADVYVNGVRMSSADITITSGNSVVFASALSTGDVVDIVAFGTFNVATINTTNAVTTGALTANGLMEVKGNSAFFSDNSNPVINIRGAGPNELMFAGDANGSATDGVSLIYRTSPDDLEIVRASGKGIIAKFNGNTGVAELWHANAGPKLSTTSTGVSIGGNLTFEDNNEIQVGTDTDLRIFHNNSHSFIREQGTGNLRVQATNFSIESGGGNQFLTTDATSGKTILYQNNNQKFETTSTGATVTGTLEATTGVTLTNGVNSKLIIESPNGTRGYQFKANVNDSSDFGFLLENLENTDIATFKNGAETILTQGSTVSGSIVHNRRLQTTATGIDVYGTDTVSGTDQTCNIRLIAEGSNEILTIRSNNGTSSYISRNGSSNGTHMFQAFDGTTTNNFLQLTNTGHTSYKNFEVQGTLDVASAMQIGPTNEFQFQNFGSSSIISHTDTGSTGMLFLTTSTSIVLANSSFGPILQCTHNTSSSTPDDVLISSATFTANGGAVFNENGADVDFRVEGDTNTHALFVQAGSNGVGIGESSPNSYHPNADDLVVSGSGTGSVGITIRAQAGHQSTLAFADGTTGDTPIQGRILYNHNGDTMNFYTNGANEHMRIDSNGQVFFGCTSTSGGVPNESGIVIQNNGNQKYRAASIGNAVNQFYNSNGTLVSQITVGSSSASLANVSDYRLKENVDYNFDATSRIKQLKPCRFNFKTDANNTIDGFLAHEVSSIVPEAVSGKKDAMTEEVLYVDGDEIPDGKKVGDIKEASRIDPQGVDPSKLVPLLVKTIQELEARITELEKA